MGEETDIAEPMSSEDVVAAEDVTADEPSKDQRRKRKKQLYKSLLELMEFYLGDVNLSKDRFMSQRIQGQPFNYVNISLFLDFNKVKALTSRVEDLAKAVSHSEILQVSDDGTQVCRKTPIRKKENEDDCTIYVEQLGPDVDHDLLTKVFSEYGPVDYVSMPRFSHNGKFKGFAFVEFRDPESAKKALEAFNARGCCLSPHMAPEELMSIKNFDPNKENKKGQPVREGDSEQRKPDMEVNDREQSSAAVEEDNDCDSVKTQEVKSDIDDEAEDERDAKKGNKKRKFSEESEKINKKLKLNHCDESEQENKKGSRNYKKEKALKHQRSVDSIKESHEEIEKNGNSESNDNVKDKKHKDKRKDKINTHVATSSEHPAEDGSTDKEEVQFEQKTHTKRQKRKHSADTNDTTGEENREKETTESVKKKIKSGTEGSTETETSQPEVDAGEGEAVKQKKKRKKKKKVKKEKSSAISLGLKVLPKREWKQLRNKYLNMQRDMMSSLKQHLSYSKWEKNKQAAAEPESKQEDVAKSGTVVKVTLDEPITNCKAAKSDLRVHPEIRYVDVTEGSSCVYLRTSTPEVAATLVQAKHWPAMELIQGDEETEYWNKIKIDREEHFKKNKPNQRGRTKLLKRAERFQGKHITTFETQ